MPIQDYALMEFKEWLAILHRRRWRHFATNNKKSPTCSLAWQLCGLPLGSPGSEYSGPSTIAKFPPLI